MSFLSINRIAALVLLETAVIRPCFANEKCRTESIDTPSGKLNHLICRNANREYTHTVLLGETPLLLDAFLAESDNNKNRSIWIYTPQSQPSTGCPLNLYLVDISKTPAIVISFGVKKACNEFQWASWGEKRSVIALKRNVKFIYENGKIKLPESGEKLWNSIEPPHAGEGLSMSDAIPFAEELALPK